MTIVDCDVERTVRAMRDNEFYNGEGYPDSTAYSAVRAENELEKRVTILVKSVKALIRLSGFELVGRIQLQDAKSGRKFW